jgi:hypothetical protein
MRLTAGRRVHATEDPHLEPAAALTDARQIRCELLARGHEGTLRPVGQSMGQPTGETILNKEAQVL